MSTMSRNNSNTSLMGFSVHQPAIGTTLQFFPAMGSKQLDEMIDAYVPGHVSILDKRAAVALEFFQHSMATGDLFKFFMVYPALSSTNPSPAMDSSDYTSFSTSPASPDSRWANPASQMASPSSSKKSIPANDFSNLPGMKIMTKDGLDVTNSASRGCKTKEQRDHAHLMRIIKACDSCRRKKTKCDPSHKRPSAGASSGKVTKKASKRSRPANTSLPIPARQASTTPEFDQMVSMSSSSIESLLADPSLVAPLDGFSMEWDQFIQYDQEATEAIPYDFDLFLDTEAYLSPATGSFSSSSTSPSQPPITPIDRDVYISRDSIIGNNSEPALPYLHPNLLEAGGNYVDFNLYSPPSSFWDEEPGLVNEVAASPVQSQSTERSCRHATAATLKVSEGKASTDRHSDGSADQEPYGSRRQCVLYNASSRRILHDSIDHLQPWPESMIVFDALSHDGVLQSQCASPLSRQDISRPETTNYHRTNSVVAGNILEGVVHEGLTGRDTVVELALSRPRSDHAKPRAARPQGGRIESTVADTTSIATVGAQSIQHGIAAATLTHSPSQQPHTDQRCGQDGEARAESSAVTPAYKPSRSITATHSAPAVITTQPGNLSHDPNGFSSAMPTSYVLSYPTTSSPSALGPFVIHIQRSSSSSTGMSPAEQRGTAAIISNSPHLVSIRSGSGSCSGSKLPSQESINSSANIDHSIPLAILSLAAYIINKWISPVKTRSPFHLGIGMSYMLLYSAVLCRPWLLASLVAFVAIWAFSLSSYHTTSLSAGGRASKTMPPQLARGEPSLRNQHHIHVKQWETPATKILLHVPCSHLSGLRLWAHPCALLTAARLRD